MTKTKLPSETTMYSINPKGGEVITHHLPWAKTSAQLNQYIEKGFTFERPSIEENPALFEKPVAPLYVSDKPPKPRKKRKVVKK